MPDKPSLTEGGAGFTLRMVVVQDGLRLSACAVTPPGGTAVVLAPGGPPSDRLSYYRGEAGAGALEEGWCAVSVEGVQLRDQGRWILEATVADTRVVRRAAADVHVYGE